MQFALIALFYGLILAVGVWASRQESADGDARSLMLAGRDLPVLVSVMTMTATWVGGGYINGTAEMVYTEGYGLLWAQAPWGYALSLILGGLVYARVMRRHNFTTMLDPFERRYGSRMTAVLFIPALIGEVFWSSAILVALGSTFGTILGYDLQTSILVSAAIAVGYTMFGGLLSVAYTDVVQLIFILIGLVIAVPYALDTVGGLDAVMTGYDKAFGANANLLPRDAMGGHAWVWADYAVLLIFGGIPWQVYFQRVLSCKSEQSARNMSLVAAVGCIVMATPAVIIGMIGATADWTALGLSPPESPSLILPHVLQYLTPPLIATVGLAAVAAAVMSSVDSSILSASSMFVWNVYKPLADPEAKPARIRWMTRGSILCVGVLATILALQVKSVYALWYLCADLVFVILFPQLTMALFDKKTNLIGAATGMAVSLVLRLGGGEQILGLPAFIPYPLTADDGTVVFPFRIFAAVMGFLTIFVVSRLTGSLSPPVPLAPPPQEEGEGEAA